MRADASDPCFRSYPTRGPHEVAPSQLGNSRGIGLNAAIGDLAAAAVRPALGGTPETYLHGIAADGPRLYAPSGYGCVPIALAILSGISIVGGVFSSDRRFGDIPSHLR
jgi:hypothetical protein